MRGKGEGSFSVKLPRRITPAYAGKSRLVQRWNVFNQDHPRLCGEKEFRRVQTSLLQGSPPPMRGKEDCVYNHVCDEGITPAYAGKSCPAQSHPRRIQDHPRLCGEKYRSFIGTFSPTGSPPPMRGKARQFVDYVQCTRITPAYAGKSPTCDFCGRGTCGSPPPMRGKANRIR